MRDPSTQSHIGLRHIGKPRPNLVVQWQCQSRLGLDGMDSIKLCVDYKHPNGQQSQMRMGSEYYEDIEPVYVEMPGWQESTVGVREYDKLPLNARLYLDRVAAEVGAPIEIVSTGPDRQDTIVINDPFAK